MKFINSFPLFIISLLTSIYSTIQINAQVFTEQISIILPKVTSCSSTWGDYNNDGLLDLLINNAGNIQIFKNNGDNTFSEKPDTTFKGLSATSVIWGDCNNDGWIDIVLLTNTKCYIFKNNGDNSFSLQQTMLLDGYYHYSIALGDYNNDGWLDILMTGNGAQVFMNKGNGIFSTTGISINFETLGKWGDFNNDGWLDIMLGGGGDFRIVKNNKNGTFTNYNVFEGFYGISAEWGDYNNDGWLDMIMSGRNDGGYAFYLYKNNANGTFTKISYPYKGGVIWADFNNDGWIDILTGSKIYKNNKDGTFDWQNGIIIPGALISFADYDNDGDLDLLLRKSDGTLAIFKNDSSGTNTLPDAPENLGIRYISNTVVLNWNKATDNQTPKNGLTYNVRMGTTPGGNDIISSQSAVNGFRKIVSMGNANADTSFIHNVIRGQTYYWSVQAIDNAFIGGAFAPEYTFTDNAEAQALNLGYTDLKSNSIKLKWTRGNGDKCIVLAKEIEYDTINLVDNTTYLADANFGNGSQIGSTGWFCVYNGTQDTITVTNLKTYTKYTFEVLDYTGAEGNEHYYLSKVTNNVTSILTNLFVPQPNISLKSKDYDFEFSAAAWCDYNNDGWLDFIYGYDSYNKGAPIIYKNNGDGTFSAQINIGLPTISVDALAWGDYNNDGWIDFALIGEDYSWNPVSKIFKNNGDGTFTEVPYAIKVPVCRGSVSWADFNNDGRLDIVISGLTDQFSSSTGTTIVYLNNGDGTFSKLTQLFGVRNSSISCADYNKDGWVDILLVGIGNTQIVSKVYKNNGDGTFTEQPGFDLPTGIADGDYISAAWGDYDSDGWFDFVVSGYVNGQPITKLYKNNGDSSFTYQSNINLPSGKVSWGDYNNDGLLDLLLVGINKSSTTKLFKNLGDGTFTEAQGVFLNGVTNGLGSFADFDNNGGLDILLTGYGTQKLYRNELTQSSAPIENLKPTNLYQAINCNNVTLNWDPNQLQKSSSTGVTYNIRIGTTKGGSDIVSSNSDSIGFRRIASIGNVQTDTFFSLQALPQGTYYWSVQAINNSYQGSKFSEEKSFVIDYSTNNISLRVDSSKLIGTSKNQQYSLNSKDGVNGNWITCDSLQTTVNFGTGGYTFWLRELVNNSACYYKYLIDKQASAPTFAIDFFNETTDSAISQVFEYSTDSDMIITVTGTNNKLKVIPAQNMYFRIKATANKVSSQIQKLIVPERPLKPSYSIDFVNENTNESINDCFCSENYYYSSKPDKLTGVHGNNQKLKLIPNQNIYFWEGAWFNSFSSDIQTLIVPPRPKTPEYSIDFRNEATQQAISSTDAYSINLDMSDSTIGAEQKLYLTPGQNVYFMTNASDTSFKSEIQALVVPKRPKAPTNSVVDDIANTFDWNFNPDYDLVNNYEYLMLNDTIWNTCPSKPIQIGEIDVPSGLLKLRVKAGDANFVSLPLISNASFTSTTGMKYNSITSISVSPNPTNSIIFIYNLTGKAYATIFNSQGIKLKSVILSDFNNRIDVKDLPYGLYILCIETLSQHIYFKFEKE